MDPRKMKNKLMN